MPEIRIHDFPDRPFEKAGVGDVPPTPAPISREKQEQERDNKTKRRVGRRIGIGSKCR